MEECELCGRQATRTFSVTIEGAELKVCAVCAESEGVVIKPEPKVRKGIMKRSIPQAAKEEEETAIVDDYGERIRNAREAMKIPLSVMAEMINEKQSFLARVELGKIMPSEELMKKLEKFLKIALTEKKDVEKGGYGRSNSDGRSIGDFIIKKE